ncbi:MAG: YHYH protein [Alphaproteobacteria bacterium]|nr:YHYH protein [Alphaproteobacteria bacterium]
MRGHGRVGAALLAVGLGFFSASAMAEADGGLLPLGDGFITAEPAIGNVFSCQQRFNPNGPGARAEGPWLKGEMWDPAEKVKVQGAVTWPDAMLAITADGETRRIRGNNLPFHPTGTFPIDPDDPAHYYDRNPNPIRALSFDLALPRVPEPAATPSCVPMGMIGVSLTGGVLYNALDVRGKDAAAHEILDACGGHPQGAGQYHYHTPSPCMLDTSGPAGGHSDLVGYALDGFGVYGLHGEGGERLSSADLDACHGHEHEIAWDGEARTLYHYHLTPDYPYTLGCFRGTPVAQPRFPRPERRPPPL